VVYTDYSYHRDGDGITSERAFSLFVARVAAELGSVVLLGRLAPAAGRSRYAIGDGVEFVPLPWYRSLTHPWEALRAAAGSLRAFWAALEGADAAWLLGPHPFAIAFALVALARRKRVILGVRQDTPAYIRARHPGRRHLHVAGSAMDFAYRLLARRCPVVVVGPGLAETYAHSRRLLEIAVSLVTADQVVDVETAAARSYDGELNVLSVGRLEEEKNPLLLADVLAGLNEADHRWRLIVCGEGPLAAGLEARLAELGVADRAELVGYVPLDKGLMDLYRQSHALLHISLTEGFPQVLVEAFAAGLPVVATAVGGIPAAAGDAAILIPPRDAPAAVAALQRLAGDPGERRRLLGAGNRKVAARTLEIEAGRVADFIRS